MKNVQQLYKSEFWYVYSIQFLTISWWWIWYISWMVEHTCNSFYHQPLSHYFLYTGHSAVCYSHKKYYRWQTVVSLVMAIMNNILNLWHEGGGELTMMEILLLIVMLGLIIITINSKMYCLMDHSAHLTPCGNLIVTLK